MYTPTNTPTKYCIHEMFGGVGGGLKYNLVSLTQMHTDMSIQKQNTGLVNNLYRKRNSFYILLYFELCG